jgi:histidine kinase/DNA gyrase B/HSP90-like ATPase
MTKVLDIKPESDFLRTLTSSTGSNAITELIWNSLDADSTNIYVESKKNAINNYDSIVIKDDGHGISYKDSESIFSSIGGSIKLKKSESPDGRIYHGKLGRGRYKSLALGSEVIYNTTYKQEKDSFWTYNINLNLNNIRKVEISDEVRGNEFSKGTTVTIKDVNSEKAEQAFSSEEIDTYIQTFILYKLKYPDINIHINGKSLDFETIIKARNEKLVNIDIDGIPYEFKLKFIRWNRDIPSKTFWCKENGLPIYENNSLVIKTGMSISTFISSIYFDEDEISNSLLLGNLSEKFDKIKEEVKKELKEFVSTEMHKNSKDYIKSLKSSRIYPYKRKPKNDIERSSRKVFDIIALTVHNTWNKFDEEDNKSKKAILTLIKQALETNPTSLKKILQEVIELPIKKQDELSELIEELSLSYIIDATKVINDRLKFISGLEYIIFDTVANKKVLERKHLHKLLEKQSWIFGDEYILGASDNSLKTVLEKYINHLGREKLNSEVEFEKNVNSETNLNKIPDICFWKQQRLNYGEDLHNLVVELKRPNLKAGRKETNQIEEYAEFISKDPRFNELSTKWTIILVVIDTDDSIESKMNQINREYGHIQESKHVNVYVKKWSQIINDAKAKHEFLKEKLNTNWVKDETAKEYISNLYKEFLPEDF